MSKSYNSIYGSYIEQYIEMKKALGFKYLTDGFVLRKIDSLAGERGEVSPGITREFADKWCKKRPNESDSYRYNRVRLLAQFSSYLRDLGIQSYIPKLPRFPQSTFIPYIFSQKEIGAIFKACDQLRLRQVNMDSCLISMPALLRLLYCTGIRISEALALKDEDVNLDENFILVRDCKSRKERIIPISVSLTSVCKDYLKYRNQLPLRKPPTGYFFVKLDGSNCGPSVRSWFRKCLSKAGIQYVGGKLGPRIHDLRHTFAVTSLASMAEAGIDLYVSLPILSNYLGHQSLSSTNHYVRLTANMFPELIKDLDMISLDVFPKFNNYEDY